MIIPIFMKYDSMYYDISKDRFYSGWTVLWFVFRCKKIKKSCNISIYETTVGLCWSILSKFSAEVI